LIEPNLDAEKSVIAAILIKPEEVLPVAVMELAEDDFQSAVCRNLFAACKSLYNLNKPVDAVTVGGKLGEDYRPVIATAIQMIPAAHHYSEYIQIVKETAKRINAYNEAAHLLTELEIGELGDCQRMAVRACEMLNTTSGKRAYSAKELFERFYATKQEPKTYIQTGFQRLDKYLFLDRGDYIVIGARPSVGKTAFTLQMMLQMARKYRVAYFSLETNPDKVMDRLAANYTRTPLAQIKRGEIADWGRIAEAYDSFKQYQFHVIQAAGWTVDQIKAQAVQLGADVIFVDYLGLVKGDGSKIYERVTNISIGLHTMAQQSGIAVIALCQLSREGNGVPSLIHLRDSGQIEQDADAVLFLHRREKEDQDRDLIIAKNKEGQTGCIRLGFDGEIQRFAEVEYRYAGSE
jgi:probable plasmid replicative DNA helicase